LNLTLQSFVLFFFFRLASCFFLYVFLGLSFVYGLGVSLGIGCH